VTIRKFVILEALLSACPDMNPKASIAFHPSSRCPSPPRSLAQHSILGQTPPI